MSGQGSKEMKVKTYRDKSAFSCNIDDIYPNNGWLR